MSLAHLFPDDPTRTHARRNGNNATLKSDHRGSPTGNGQVEKPKPTRRAYSSPEAALARVIEVLGTPTAWWAYLDAEGFESFRVYRFDCRSEDGATEKDYRPVHTTPQGWTMGDPPGPLPLYWLPELARASLVFVTEGEKTTDLVRDRGLTATTSAHGAKSAHKSDWTPLAGKDVVILPDNDSEGEFYTKSLCSILATLDPRPRVKVIRLEALWRSSKPIPSGGDFEEWLSDGVPENWTGEDCSAELERRAERAPVIDLDALGIAAEPRRVVMRRASEIEELAVEWLWKDRIPLGMLSLFAGDPKLGKSFLTMAMAASVSRGASLPMDDRPPQPGSVIVMSAEDDAARTIVPRLRSAGAILDKVHILESIILDSGSEALPSLRTDLNRIEEAAKSVADCKMIIIDPITAYLFGIDDHRNSELRGTLSPLKMLAERLGIAIVLVSHTNKAGGSNGKYRVQGSIAYVGACRANFLFLKDRDDPTGRRVLMLDNGCNLAPAVPTLAYLIEDRGDGPRVEWEVESVPITTEEALNADPEASDDRSEAREVDRWLRQLLADGPVDTKEIMRQCKDGAFSPDQVKRAKKRLRVRADKHGFGPDSLWKWALPEHASTEEENAKSAQRERREQGE
jgi:hypothetical protein